MTKKILIFDVEGEYGHFRKFNTTTSPLTYPVPTRPSVSGLLGAITGIKRPRWSTETGCLTPAHKTFGKKSADIAIQIINPVKKVHIGFNLVNTKNSFYDVKKNRTQINFELIKNPKFRIFFHHKEPDILNSVIEKIKKKGPAYTIYLGLAQMLADIQLVDVVEASEKFNSDNEYIPIKTIINLNLLKNKLNQDPIRFDKSAHYVANTMPVDMNCHREVLEFADILMELNGQSIDVKVDTFFDVGSYGNIVFL